MTAASTIPQAKKRILANLAAAFAGDDDHEVTYGKKPSAASRKTNVGRVVGVVDDVDNDNRPMPFGLLSERYTGIITTSASMGTSDLEEVEAQLYADYATARATILGDPTLGDLAGVVEALPTGALESDDDELDGDAGRAAWLVWGVTVDATLELR